MKEWWRRRSLKLRLALWFTAVASVILLGLTPVVYALIEHRLHLEFDNELSIDWQSVSSRLEIAPNGALRWHSAGSANDDLAHAASWFEVWSGEGKLLLKHWPASQANKAGLEPPLHGESFHTFERADGLAARAMERDLQVGESLVWLRVLRDEAGFHRTLREILIGFALGVPLAAFLSAVGGYVMAGRTLKPISMMVERARQISSESLNERLPNPNPHDELGQLATVFNETLQRIQESFDALRRFTADASHELRTPLTALRAVGEVGLGENASSTALRDTIASMLEEAEHLHGLIESLLLLARVESGRNPLNLEPLRLDQLADEARERVSILAVEKKQEIEVISRAITARGDRLFTRQAVMNILDNAIRYSPTGARIVLQFCQRESQAGIEIADNGPGIAAEYHHKIFERFFRIDKARSRSEGGAGLGLAISKMLVEQQGGKIEIESAPGRGSVFRVLLPASSSIERSSGGAVLRNLQDVRIGERPTSP